MEVLRQAAPTCDTCHEAMARDSEAQNPFLPCDGLKRESNEGFRGKSLAIHGRFRCCLLLGRMLFVWRCCTDDGVGPAELVSFGHLAEVTRWSLVSAMNHGARIETTATRSSSSGWSFDQVSGELAPPSPPTSPWEREQFVDLGNWRLSTEVFLDLIMHMICESKPTKPWQVDIPDRGIC